MFLELTIKTGEKVTVNTAAYVKIETGTANDTETGEVISVTKLFPDPDSRDSFPASVIETPDEIIEACDDFIRITDMDGYDYHLNKAFIQAIRQLKPRADNPRFIPRTRIFTTTGFYHDVQETEEDIRAMLGPLSVLQTNDEQNAIKKTS